MIVENKNIAHSLSLLFKECFNTLPLQIIQLPNSGSNRIYFRLLKNEISVIGVYNNYYNENIAFINYTNQLIANRINVPEIITKKLDENIYLITDLGDVTLLDWLKNQNNNSIFNNRSIEMYKQVIRELVRIQIVAGNSFSFEHAFDFKVFNQESIFYDLEYFKSKFLNTIDLKYNEIELNKDFKAFSKYLSAAENDFFMFRDFQSRNIMIYKDELFFIDYQGGRKGPLQYDLVSLLFQAKAQIPENIKLILLDYYIQLAQLFVPINKDEFKEYYYAFALLRVLQTLGAYGLRGLIEKKSHFIESIPLAIENLRNLYQKVEYLAKLKELNKIINQLINTDIKLYE